MEKQLSKVFILAIIIGVVSMQSVSALTAAPTTSMPVAPTSTPTVSVTPTVSDTITVAPTETPTPTPTKQVYLQLNAQLGTQSPWNKRIPVTLSVRPLIDGQKITITWQKRTGIEAAPQYTSIDNPKAKQVYSFTFSLTPQAIGYQRTVAEVVLVTDTSNYVASQDVVVNLDENKIVTPASAGYQTAQLFMYGSIIVFFVILVPAGLFFGGKYFQKNILPKWYAKQIQVPQG